MTLASALPSDDVGTVFPSLHEPFLQRASDPELAGDSREALGAFLTLRFADRAAERAEGGEDALAYQARATKEYLDDLMPSEERTHLNEIVRVAGAVGRGKATHLLCPPLLAYAYWLEQALRLEEALDVVETAQRIRDLLPEEVVNSLLQRARIQRLLGRLEEARGSYAAARGQAEELGDRHTVLLSRIGDAIVARQLGNLPASEAALRDVLNDAEAWGDRDAAARAHHDLGVALSYEDRPAEAIPHLHAAFERYELEPHRLRALSDLGLSLKRLGQRNAAKHALTVVIERSQSVQVRAPAMLELMELAALSHDRVAFQRWRSRLLTLQDSLSAEMYTDFLLKVGTGTALFGNLRSAREYLGRAVRHAEEWKLNDYLFRAETALREVEAQNLPAAAGPNDARDLNGPEVSAIAERVLALRAASW